MKFLCYVTNCHFKEYVLDINNTDMIYLYVSCLYYLYCFYTEWISHNKQTEVIQMIATQVVTFTLMGTYQSK